MLVLFLIVNIGLQLGLWHGFMFKDVINYTKMIEFSYDEDLVELVFENEADSANADLSHVEYNQALLLVSADYPIDESFEACVSEYKDSGVLMNDAIMDAYSDLSQAVLDNCNDHLYVESSYRTYEHQQELYEELGPEIAAVAGTSEHETGLALDVYVMYYGGAGFTDSQAGQFVNSNCGDYGFIIRYPRGAEDITGFDYEPWHIRYVGLPHSTIIMDSHYTLEEYVASYDIGQYYSVQNCIIGRMPIDNVEIPSQYLDGTYNIQISPDNTGCIFVTIFVE